MYKGLLRCDYDLHNSWRNMLLDERLYIAHRYCAAMYSTLSLYRSIELRRILLSLGRGPHMMKMSTGRSVCNYSIDLNHACSPPITIISTETITKPKPKLRQPRAESGIGPNMYTECVTTSFPPSQTQTQTTDAYRVSTRSRSSTILYIRGRRLPASASINGRGQAPYPLFQCG